MDLPNKPLNAANPAQTAALNAEKAKALAAALAQIEKQFGKGTIMKLGAGEVIEDIQVVSTGSLGLDIALGVGGLPRGRVVEIYGPESSGKTMGAPFLAGDLFQAITESTHSGYAHRAFFDLFTQPMDVDLNGVVAHFFTPLAQALNQLVLADQPPDALQQHFEQPQLAG